MKTIVGVALIAAGIFFLVAGSYLPMFATVMPITNIVSRSGLSYQAPLGNSGITERDVRLDARLYRTLVPPDWTCALAGPRLCRNSWQDIGIPHAAHADIAGLGGGRFSVWDGWLIFSSADGSDPRLTGKYWLRIEHPAAISAAASVCAVAAALLLLPPARSRRRQLFLLIVGLAACLLLIRVRNDLFGAPIALAGLLLLPLAALPAMRARSVPAGIVMLLLGFALTSACLGELFAWQHRVRKNYAAQVVPQLASLRTDQPVLLILGSSLAANALDPASLEAALAAAGHPRRFAGLAWGGMSPIEWNHYLFQYLEEVRQVPDEALIEISQYYDKYPGPLFQFENGLYTQRMIDIMDADTFAWAMRYLIEEDDRRFLRKLRLSGNLFVHFLLNLTNVGMISASEAADPGHTRWTPQVCVPTGEVTVQNVNRLADLSAAAAQGDMAWRDKSIISLIGPSSHKIPEELISQLDRNLHSDPWFEALLGHQISALKAAGVKKIGFFTTPTLLPTQSRYALNFCASHNDTFCARAETSDIFGQLRRAGAWADMIHLCDSSRHIYSEWLAQAIQPFLRDGS